MDLIVGNAACVVKTLADVRRLCNSAVTRIMVGSVTWQERAGNTPVPPGDVYYFNPDTQESGNALGLPNIGWQKLKRELPEMIALAHAHGKQLWVSLAGFTVDEYFAMADDAFELGVDGVQFNLACPNVHDQGAQKRMFCEQPDLVRRLLRMCHRYGFGHQEIGIKISPTTNEQLVEELCDVVRTVGDVVTEVVGVNTEPNCTFVDERGVHRLAFRAPGSDAVLHVGGRAGAPLKELALSTFRLYRKYLPPYVRYVYVGGVFIGADVLQPLREGAAGFECATALIQDGPRIFSDILSDPVLEDILELA